MLRIAIDGPGGAGKSTIAKKIAQELGIAYIDTGAMYRAVALKMVNRGVAPMEEDQVKAVLEDTLIDFDARGVLLDGQLVEQEIRRPDMGGHASDYSALGPVRAKLGALQKEIGLHKDCVMDGRDIGTNVMTFAEYKFFLTASPEERAQRRYLELMAKGEDVTFDQVLEDINRRDYNDSHRELNPLQKATDAEEVDSTHMTIDQVVAHILSRVQEEKTL